MFSREVLVALIPRSVEDSTMGTDPHLSETDRNDQQESAQDRLSFPPTFVGGFHDEKSTEKMKYNSLGATGLQVSALGIGGGGLGGFYGHVDENKAIEAVQLGLKLGLNFIDTSPWYGHNKSEELLGKALAPVPRNAYYIATKIGRYKPNVEEMFDFSARRVIQSVDESLDRLGLDYVDLIQVHDLEFASSIDLIINETLPALQQVQKSGKARFIGITGYPVQILLDVIRRSHVPIDTVLSYCRYGIFNNDLKDIIPELRRINVGIINAAPLGMGLLTDQGPPKWHSADIKLKCACKSAMNFAKSNDVELGKVALKYGYASHDVATTLVSMESPELVQSNVASVETAMTSSEQWTMDQIICKYFKPLEKTHWEGIGVKRYWENLNDSGQKHDSGVT